MAAKFRHDEFGSVASWMDKGAGVRQLWYRLDSFLQKPNSEEAFRKALPVACEQADKEFGEWYLSGLYIGDANEGQKFFVVQTLGMIERQRIHDPSSFEHAQDDPKAVDVET